MRVGGFVITAEEENLDYCAGDIDINGTAVEDDDCTKCGA
jgi:hypothetical protein